MAAVGVGLPLMVGIYYVVFIPKWFFFAIQRAWLVVKRKNQRLCCVTLSCRVQKMSGRIDAKTIPPETDFRNIDVF